MPVLEPDDGHRRPLQSLGAVEGGQLHAVLGVELHRPVSAGDDPVEELAHGGVGELEGVLVGQLRQGAGKIGVRRGSFRLRRRIAVVIVADAALAGHDELGQGAAEMTLSSGLGAARPARCGRRPPPWPRRSCGGGSPPETEPGRRGRGARWCGPERPDGTRVVRVGAPGAATAPRRRPRRRRRRNRRPRGSARRGATPGSGRTRAPHWRPRRPGVWTGGCRRAAGPMVPGRSSGRRSSRVGSAPFHP